MTLADFRKEYSGKPLTKAGMDRDPVRQFGEWFQQALSAGVHEPNAMTLATVTESGSPAQRTVLLKFFDAAGFVFFTNYNSRKAGHLAKNSHAGLLFPWLIMERQVIIQGRVEKIAMAESQTYFESRPRESQIGAWVSHQSEVIPSREFLAEKMAALDRQFADTEVPLPPFWGGYRVIPETVEFWQGGPGRLHDRIFYQLTPNGWKMERLSP